MLIFGNVVFLMYFIYQLCLSLNVISFSVAEMEEGIFKMKIQPESHLARELLFIAFLKNVLCTVFPCRYMHDCRCACTCVCVHMEARGHTVF